MNIDGNLKRKSMAALTIGLVVVVALFYGYNLHQKARLLQGGQGVDAERSFLAHRKASVDSTVLVKSNSEKKASEALTDISYSSDDAAITNDWMKRVGKLTHEERGDYAGYDEPTLIELSRNGDTKAMDVLTKLYIDRGIYTDNNLEKAQKYAEKGAIFGLVSTIPTMATLTLAPPDFLKNDNSELFANEAKSHPKLIEAVALAQTIAMRGDPDLAEIIKQYSIRDYNAGYNASVKLTAMDERAINQRAAEIYSGWQKQRRELGLGDFESPPASVKKYMDILSQKK